MSSPATRPHRVADLDASSGQAGAVPPCSEDSSGVALPPARDSRPPRPLAGPQTICFSSAGTRAFSSSARSQVASRCSSVLWSMRPAGRSATGDPWTGLAVRALTGLGRLLPGRHRVASTVVTHHRTGRVPVQALTRRQARVACLLWGRSAARGPRTGCPRCPRPLGHHPAGRHAPLAASWVASRGSCRPATCHPPIRSPGLMRTARRG